MNHPLYKYPLSQMEIGKDFIAVNPPKHLVSYLSKRGSELGRKFRTKRVPEGRRVVRVA